MDRWIDKNQTGLICIGGSLRKWSALLRYTFDNKTLNSHLNSLSECFRSQSVLTAVVAVGGSVVAVGVAVVAAAVVAVGVVVVVVVSLLLASAVSVADDLHRHSLREEQQVHTRLFRFEKRNVKIVILIDSWKQLTELVMNPMW